MADAKALPPSQGHPLDKEADTPAVRDAAVDAVEAKHASDKEHQMSLLEAIRLYPKAIGWSVLVSSTIIMEGYDLALLGNLYASPAFNKKFGTYDAAAGKYVVSAAWQSGLSNGARAGEIFGLIFAGWTSDRFGYKMTTIGSLIMMICFIFVLFFAPNVKVLVVGEILCGKSPEIFVFRPTAPGPNRCQAFHGVPSRV
jgi:SP family general alpha glucoside:H+ symporter-like MFS transporter